MRIRRTARTSPENHLTLAMAPVSGARSTGARESAATVLHNASSAVSADMRAGPLSQRGRLLQKSCSSTLSVSASDLVAHAERVGNAQASRIGIKDQRERTAIGDARDSVRVRVQHVSRSSCSSLDSRDVSYRLLRADRRLPRFAKWCG
jgi:hypothetical protein